MHKVRIVLTLIASISGPATTAVISDPCHLGAYPPTRNPGRHIAAREVKRTVKKRPTLGCCDRGLPSDTRGPPSEAAANQTARRSGSAHAAHTRSAPQ